MVLEPAYDTLSSAFLPPALTRYWVSFALFIFSALVAGDAIARYWKSRPPPPPPAGLGAVDGKGEEAAKLLP
eukprot:440350-Hanusia_phi.AAC.1